MAAQIYADLLLQLLLICAVFRSGDNFKCYICDSKTDPNCSDPLRRNMTEVIECEDFVPLLTAHLDIDPAFLMEPLLYGCQKLKVQDSKGDHVTVRTCAAFKHDSRTACDIDDNFRDMEEKFTLEFCGVCEDELCNTSVRSEVSLSLMLMTTAIAALITLRRTPFHPPHTPHTL